MLRKVSLAKEDMKTLFQPLGIAALVLLSPLAPRLMADSYSVYVPGNYGMELIGYNFAANSLNNTITNLPNNTVIHTWDVQMQNWSQTVPTYLAGYGWHPDVQLQPGTGFFIANPGTNGFWAVITGRAPGHSELLRGRFKWHLLPGQRVSPGPGSQLFGVHDQQQLCPGQPGIRGQCWRPGICLELQPAGLGWTEHPHHHTRGMEELELRRG